MEVVDIPEGASGLFGHHKINFRRTAGRSSVAAYDLSGRKGGENNLGKSHDFLNRESRS
jgi:hypothetical protein